MEKASEKLKIGKLIRSSQRLRMVRDLCLALAALVSVSNSFRISRSSAKIKHNVLAYSRPGGNAGSQVFGSGDDHPVILFDGVCNLCNGGVNFALDWDPAGRFRFAALQSESGRALLVRAGRRPDDISSIVLVERDRAYVKSEAVLRIASKLGNPFPFLVLIMTIFFEV